MSPGHDAAHWDERYSGRELVWSVQPNPTIERLLGEVEPGTALDVAAGEGRHAMWLARLGWRVTAVDFSGVGIDRGRQLADRLGISVDWTVADVADWEPPPGTTYDVVLIAYFHLDSDRLDRVADWVAPGGRLVVLGHSLRNLTDGVGGPQDAGVLYTQETLRRAAGPLRIETLQEVIRTTADGDSIDLLLVARES